MKKFKKLSALTISLLLTMVFAVGGTLAYLYMSTGSVENTFTPTQSYCEVVETFEEGGITKSNVKVKLPSNVTPENVKSYVRVAVIYTLRDANGNVTPEKPVEQLNGENAEGKHYKVVQTSPNWVYNEADGFYYYKLPVEVGTETANLFDSITALNGALLNVDIYAQSIQAEGVKGTTKAVVDAWGVDPSTLK